MKTLTINGALFTCPYADLLPPLTAQERKLLHADIAANGVRCPVIVTPGNVLIDGHTRAEIGEQLKKHIPVEVVNFGSGGAERHAAITLNLHRRHLTRKQKRALAAAMLRAHPEKSNRSIAESVNADDKTIASVRTELETTAEIPQLNKTQGSDGKTRTARKPSASTVSSGSQAQKFMVTARSLDSLLRQVRKLLNDGCFDPTTGCNLIAEVRRLANELEQQIVTSARSSPAAMDVLGVEIEEGEIP
jgi:hypothetical protein